MIIGFVLYVNYSLSLTYLVYLYLLYLVKKLTNMLLFSSL